MVLSLPVTTALRWFITNTEGEEINIVASEQTCKVLYITYVPDFTHFIINVVDRKLQLAMNIAKGVAVVGTVAVIGGGVAVAGAL